jgi:hypothetical protein
MAPSMMFVTTSVLCLCNTYSEEGMPKQHVGAAIIYIYNLLEDGLDLPVRMRVSIKSEGRRLRNQAHKR